MSSLSQARRIAALVGGLAAAGALAAFGSTSALANTTIYGSGAAAQNLLQSDVLIPGSGYPVTWTSTSSGSGFTEFGNSGTLTPSEDKTADADSGSLDAYVATDSAPTTTQLGDAQSASGSASENEIAVPVAQTPLVIDISLPSGLLLNTSASIKLPWALLGEIFAGSIPASSPYAANTWGALLQGLGLTPISSGSPTTSQFLDTGGGTATIGVEARANGAGTTYTLKQYLQSVDSTDWSGITLDQNVYPLGSGTEWPSTGGNIVNGTGNSSDAAEALAVDENPGTIGYSTLGDALSNLTPFNETPTSVTDGGSALHQILLALLQDGTSHGSPTYASPSVSGSPGEPNTYTGTVATNGGSGVEDWIVPSSYLTGSWYGTSASDSDIGSGYYPLTLVAWDLGWENYNLGNLSSDYPLGNSGSATTVADYLQWIVNSSDGQAAIDNWGTGTGEDDYYYAELPSNIQTDAQSAAADIG